MGRFDALVTKPKSSDGDVHPRIAAVRGCAVPVVNSIQQALLDRNTFVFHRFWTCPLLPFGTEYLSMPQLEISKILRSGL